MNVTAINTSRIAAESKLQKESSGNSTPATTDTAAGQAVTQDRFNPSSNDHTVAALAEKALQTSPARQAKVEALKQAVKGGEYKPDSNKIAASLSDANV